MNWTRVASAVIVVVLTACSGESPERAAPALAAQQETQPEPGPVALGPVEPLPSPAGEASAEPFLTMRGDSLVLSWLERPANDGVATLRTATRSGEAWSQPQTIVEAKNLFVNWADFPSVTPLPDGGMLAHWLQKSGAGSYAYDVRLASSLDGATWGSSIVPHDDGTETEHGFVSALPHPDGKRVAVIWLDGRNTAGSHGHEGPGSMTLRFAAVDPDTMTLSDEAVLDDRVCDCCQTSLAMSTAGPVVVYRDRSEKEIRDISVVRWTGGAWSAPATIHSDGWEINGCPVNGPQIASDGDRLAVAWFSAARNEPRVNVAFSTDGGATFSNPVRIDDGNALGRVDVVMHRSGAAIVTWMEEAGKAATIRARVVSPDGAKSESITIAQTASARNAGFPRIASDGRNVYFSWTEPGAASHVRLAAAAIREGSRK